MIIGIDGNEANQVQRVGVGQFAFNIISSLSKIDHQNEYCIFLKQPPLKDMPPESTNWHYQVFGPQKLWTKIALPLHLFFSKVKYDLIYSPSHYSPHFSPFPTMPTIHDIGYLNNPNEFNKKDYYQLVNWTKRSIQKASKIAAVSNFTKNELIKTYSLEPQKIFIVPNGVNQINSPSLKVINQTLSKYQLTKSKYYISVGTLKPNKNYPFLIESFAQFHQENPEIKLVIAGKKGWVYDSIFETVTKLKIANSIIFTDFIDENTKIALVSQSIATVIPSTYEGFGIPAIESQMLGVPVISSNIPPLKEILSDSAIFIDPTNHTDLLQAFTKVLNKDIAKKLIDQGYSNSASYSWDHAAQKLLTAITNNKTNI